MKCVCLVSFWVLFPSSVQFRSPVVFRPVINNPVRQSSQFPHCDTSTVTSLRATMQIQIIWYGNLQRQYSHSITVFRPAKILGKFSWIGTFVSYLPSISISNFIYFPFPFVHFFLFCHSFFFAFFRCSLYCKSFYFFACKTGNFRACTSAGTQVVGGEHKVL